MSIQREESPDWLRSFQPPSQSAICLSSGSESPSDHNPESDDEDDINLSKLFKKKVSQVPSVKDKLPVVDKTSERKFLGQNEKVNLTPAKKRKEDANKNQENVSKGITAKRGTPENHGNPYGRKHSIWALSSDSEPSPNVSPAKKDKFVKNELSAESEGTITNDIKDLDAIFIDQDEKSLNSEVKSPLNNLERGAEKTTKKKSVNKNVNGEANISAKNNVAKEDISGIHPVPQVSSSCVPLLISEKVQYSKALVECAGDSIDLSGDLGAVGRIIIPDDSKDHGMLLDLKGTIYKTTIVPSRTFCVVSFGQSEAKVEAIMNDYIQLKPQSNVYEAETMVEGTLEGFSFGSEDEAEKVPKADEPENEGEQQTLGKSKKGQKTAVARRNKGKSTGGKPPKKVKKKPQAPKKTKMKN